MTTAHNEIYLGDLGQVCMIWGGVRWEESCMRPHRSYSSRGQHQEREEGKGEKVGDGAFVSN